MNGKLMAVISLVCLMLTAGSCDYMYQNDPRINAEAWAINAQTDMAVARQAVELQAAQQLAQAKAQAEVIRAQAEADAIRQDGLTKSIVLSISIGLPLLIIAIAILVAVLNKQKQSYQYFAETTSNSGKITVYQQPNGIVKISDAYGNVRMLNPQNTADMRMLQYMSNNTDWRR